MTKKDIDLKTQKEISVFLPSAISKTLNSYEEFITTNEKQDAKNFSAHHTACKAAISHLELLLKLAQWAHLPEVGGGDEAQNLAIMLSKAKNKVMAHKDTE